MTSGRVVVAMSGGVDSSVTAALLKEAGYEVIGVTMRLPGDSSASHSCCSAEGADDARRVCQVLGIPFYFLNFERHFQAYVIDYFCEEYRQGRTPNPCIACNERIKFDLLLSKALAMGADYLATGHYARIEQRDSRRYLLKALDTAKDQSYFLYTLHQKELEHLLFPLGRYQKAEVRGMAREKGLPVWAKAESQEICFIPDNDYRRFLAQRIPRKPGEITDSEGKVLGRHRGVAFYTVGQRHGLGLSAREPLYVLRIDPARNTLVVGPREQLLANTLYAGRVHWVSGEEPQGPTTITAKIRHKCPEATAVLKPQPNGVVVHFDQPQQAITPGQSVVFYDGEVVLGGGVIEIPQPHSGDFACRPWLPAAKHHDMMEQRG